MLSTREVLRLKFNHCDSLFIWNFKTIVALGAICILRKGKGVGGIAKYLPFLTGVGGWFWITLM